MIRNVELRIVNYVLANQVGQSNNVGGTYSKYDVGNIANYQSLDLFEDESINITLQNQDINDFSKIKINFSKTFNIPATPKNNRYLIDPGNISKLYTTAPNPLFPGVYNLVVNVDTFNYPIPSQIWVDGDLVLEGQLNIKGVNRNTTPNLIECIFTTDIKSLFPILKQQSFNAEYFRRPVTDSFLQPGETRPQPVSLIPANFIWESILLDNFQFQYATEYAPGFPNKEQLFPVWDATYSLPYPIYSKNDIQGSSDKMNLMNHVVSSWTQSNHKYFWGLIDTGQRPYIDTKLDKHMMRINQELDKDHKCPSQLLTSYHTIYDGSQFSGRTNRTSRLKSYRIFDDIRPYYYVNDIFKKIIRWTEYKLNGEFFEYTTLKDTFPQYTDYNEPLVEYKNTPIRFQFDTDFFDDNDAAKDYVFIHPENEQFSNGEFSVSLRTLVTADAGNPPSVNIYATASIQKMPIDFEETSSDWDEYSIIYMRLDVSNSFAGTHTVTYDPSIKFDNITFELPRFTVGANSGTSRSYMFGNGTFSTLPSEIRNNLPTGYTQSLYYNLATQNTFRIDKFKYYFANANDIPFAQESDEYVPGSLNTLQTRKFSTIGGTSEAINNVPLGYWPAGSNSLISATFGVSATIKPQTTLFDVRRYVYPELSDYTMGDFLQDICRIFNLKYEEPQPQSASGLIQFKSFENYIRSNIDTYGIKDLSDIITADKMKINKTQYGLISLKRAEQEGDLNDLFYKNDIEKTGYGDYYNEFLSYNNNDKKLNIETKLSYGVSNYLMTSYGERSYYSIGGVVTDSFSDIIDYGFTYQRKNSKPIQVHTALSYNDYNLSKVPTVDQSYSVRDYEVKKTKIKPFILYNQRDARIFTIINGYDTPSNTTYSTTYSTYQIQTGGNTIMPYDQVNQCGLFPNLTNYDGQNRSIIFDNLNGNVSLDAASQSGYTAWYQAEIDNINGLFIIDTEVDLKLLQFNEFTFAQLYKLKIQGEYKLFRINKLSDFTLNDDSLTKIQLVEIPNAQKWLGITQSYQRVNFGPSGI